MPVCKLNPRPFLKWAGGKGQLLDQFDGFFPEELKTGAISIYAEPFLGGGAVFFHVANQYPFKRVLLSDINAEIIQVYRIIQDMPEKLISELAQLEESYLDRDEAGRRRFYLETRKSFNAGKPVSGVAGIRRAAELVFLNRTCYNGLFRMNSRGEFNAPPGRYQNPRIADPANLLSVSRTLQNADIGVYDFSRVLSLLKTRPAQPKKAFVYFDPPYQPLSKTARFTSYHKSGFGTNEQERLAAIFRELDKLGAKVMLSNSDPKNGSVRSLYRGFNIRTVQARRSINSKGALRGKLQELVIMNY